MIGIKKSKDCNGLDKVRWKNNIETKVQKDMEI